MKTTIEVADDLIRRARRIQKRDAVTLRALVEEGLRVALEKREHLKPFKFEPLIVDGKGLTAEASAAGWQRIVAMANDR